MTAGSWSIEPRPAPDGVELAISLLADDGTVPTTILLPLGRAEARRLAKLILAAAGDGTQRTFPRPALVPQATGPAFA